MHVLLIQPPIHDFYQTAVRTQPLGLAYLAAALRDAGHTVTLLDCQPPGVRTPASLPPALAEVQRFYPKKDISPFKLHSKYYRFGLSLRSIADKIRIVQPDAVGISCQYTPYVNDVMEVAALVKSILPAKPVIVGGAHASALPGHVLGSPSIDYVVIGEGERTLVSLLGCIQRGEQPDYVPGIAFKNGTAMHLTQPAGFIENLDEMPFPARDLLGLHRYTVRGRPYTMVLTGRGCPYGCTYCSVAAVMGRKVRLRSPENIVAEIRHCIERYGITIFDIEDDHFTADPRRAEDILELLIQSFGENALELYAMNGLSLLSLNKRLLAAMKRAGFRKLDLALGCTTPSEGRIAGRRVNRGAATRIIREVDRLGIPSTTYVIIGMPGQRLRDMVAGIAYLAGLPTRIGPSVFYPSPGSTLYAVLAKEHALSDDFSVLRSSIFPSVPHTCSRLELVTLVRLVRWINWIKQMLARHHEAAMQLSRLFHDARFCLVPTLEMCERIASEGSVVHRFPSVLHGDDAGRLLTGMLLQSGVFCGLRRCRQKETQGIVYELFAYETAEAVVQEFLHGPRDPLIAAVTVSERRA
ncbi:MAG: B12-binding domain-containing radical SAM protein [Desulfobacterota bacterium]|nr:B12-binding domain-containing radical SAM protein [Thermodesulfobacteriota bacterium]